MSTSTTMKQVQILGADLRIYTLNRRSGWLVGPYVTGRIGVSSLTYDLRAGYGEADNKVRPSMAAASEYTTKREMVSGSLSGAIARGNYTVKPTGNLLYWRETQNAFTDSLGNSISQSVQKLGEARFGPTISRRFTKPNGDSVEPSVGVSRIYNFAGLRNDNISSFSLGRGDVRARLDVGVQANKASGLSVDSSVFYDGIGIDDYESYGFSLRLTQPLN